jgi:hypothetical protein
LMVSGGLWLLNANGKWGKKKEKEEKKKREEYIPDKKRSSFMTLGYDWNESLHLQYQISVRVASFTCSTPYRRRGAGGRDRLCREIWILASSWRNSHQRGLCVHLWTSLVYSQRQGPFGCFFGLLGDTTGRVSVQPSVSHLFPLLYLFLNECIAQTTDATVSQKRS